MDFLYEKVHIFAEKEGRMYKTNINYLATRPMGYFVP